MKNAFIFFACILVINVLPGCRSTKKLQSAVSKKDTVVIAANTPVIDTAKEIENILVNIKKNHIDFKTFSAKIKVDYTDNRGRQPDVNAFVRIKKDSIIWISINATFLNIEAFRILINKDSMWILNKLEKKVEYHSLDYLEKVAKIPLDFNTLQDLIIGNPVFLGGKIVNYRTTENRILISAIDEHFKNLLTLSASDYLLERSKLDDLNVAQNRTADLTYFDYENKQGVNFSTLREISVAEKTKVDIMLNYKQYDFNNGLSFPFIIPKNYKPK
ncbi:MAG: DUF4292 domain-containing protein [Ginsengibacter sp.]